MPAAPDMIEVKLTTTNVLTRWPCHVCGGCTEKVTVLAEVADGPLQGFRVCEQCLQAGNIDERLQQHADAAEARIPKIREHAAKLRALVGRIKVPTWEEYEAYDARNEVATWLSLVANDHDAAKRVMTDDALFNAMRRSWLYIEHLNRGSNREEAARLTAEVLGITEDDAAARLSVARYGAYCMGSAHGDSDPKVQETWEQVLTDAALREHYAKQQAKHDASKAEQWEGLPF